MQFAICCEDMMDSHLQSADIEQFRIRELKRFYAPSGAVSDNDQAVSESLTVDITLKVLNQIGLYRFDCAYARTALVLDGQRHIIAEASTAGFASRHQRNSRDSGVDLGEDVSFRPRRASVMEGTGPPGIGTCGMIRDTTKWRFEAEVPLYSPKGYVLGSYTILDENERNAPQNAEFEALQEIADSIANHLENTLIQQRDKKSRRIMKGLSAFGLHARSEGDTGENYPDGDSALRSINWEAGNCGVSTGEVSPRTLVPQCPGRICPHELDTKTSLPSLLPLETISKISLDNATESRACKASTLVSVSDASMVSEQISSLFARASSIIRECLNVDGATFLGPSGATSRRRASGGRDAMQCNENRLCEVLGFESNDSHNGSRLTEDLLYDMTAAFPDGHILEIGQGSRTSSKGKQSESRFISRLGDHFPDARSFLLFPLWDWTKPNWLAVCILWSTEGGRFYLEDLDYMRLFSNFIISQVAQADWAGTEKSKSDLLSSLSHELRSPLHGVLASAELLQSTALQPAQQEMVGMVETCSATLLDTMNCLLDFAKINNLTTESAKTSIPQREGLATKFDLDSLVEDVTSSLCAGRRVPKHASQPSSWYQTDSGDPSYTAEIDSKLSIVVWVEDQKAWKIRSISGTWRRLVMNLLGNALKFTSEGYIEVALSKSQTTDDGRTLVHLSVTDTGRGISPEFLHKNIFTPFSQEDPLTEGVGLGLNIVHRLVTSLGGYVEISSEVGHGTQVDVFVPVEWVPVRRVSVVLDEPTKVCIIGFGGDTDTKKAFDIESRRNHVIKRSLNNIISSQPGWSVSFAEAFNEASGDIAVIEEDTLREMTADGPIPAAFELLVVLCGDRAPICANNTIHGTEITYVTQPIGPHKILDVLEKTDTSSQQNRARPPRTSSLFRQQSITKHVSDVLDYSRSSASTSRERGLTDKRPSPEIGEAQKRLHVLIVDDNDINLKVLETFMRKIEISYETACNGQVAVDKYRQSTRDFDYILMDITMPVMDGIEATTKIRKYELQQALRPSTIMAVTGVASAAMQKRAFDAGVNDYLVKPISLHELKRIMDIQ